MAPHQRAETFTRSARQGHVQRGFYHRLRSRVLCALATLDAVAACRGARRGVVCSADTARRRAHARPGSHDLRRRLPALRPHRAGWRIAQARRVGGTDDRPRCSPRTSDPEEELRRVGKDSGFRSPLPVPSSVAPRRRRSRRRRSSTRRACSATTTRARPPPRECDARCARAQRVFEAERARGRSPAVSPAPAASSRPSSIRQPCSTRWCSRRRSSCTPTPARSGCSRTASSSSARPKAAARTRRSERAAPQMPGSRETSCSRARPSPSKTPAPIPVSASSTRCCVAAMPRISASRWPGRKEHRSASSPSMRPSRDRGARRRSRRCWRSRRAHRRRSRMPSSTSACLEKDGALILANIADGIVAVDREGEVARTPPPEDHVPPTRSGVRPFRCPAHARVRDDHRRAIAWCRSCAAARRCFCR